MNLNCAILRSNPMIQQMVFNYHQKTYKSDLDIKFELYKGNIELI